MELHTNTLYIAELVEARTMIAADGPGGGLGWRPNRKMVNNVGFDYNRLLQGRQGTMQICQQMIKQMHTQSWHYKSPLHASKPTGMKHGWTEARGH